MPVKIPHLFILDPIHTLNITLDSSLRMIAALMELGHEVWLGSVDQLFWHSGQSPKVSAQIVEEFGYAHLVQGKIPILGGEFSKSLADFRFIHMRKDPPVDEKYILNTWLLEAAHTNVINHPGALRGLNEKVATLLFPKEALKTFLSCNVAQIIKFITDECNGHCVLKPVLGHGGRGVEQLVSHDEKELTQKVREKTKDGSLYTIVQPFEKKIHEGEIRVTCLGGEVWESVLKVPAKGNFLANLSAGPTLHSIKLPEIVKKRAVRVAKDLLKNGVHIVGFDMIGGYISEINLTSPRIILAPDAEIIKVYTKFANYFSRLNKKGQ